LVSLGNVDNKEYFKRASHSNESTEIPLAQNKYLLIFFIVHSQKRETERERERERPTGCLSSHGTCITVLQPQVYWLFIYDRLGLLTQKHHSMNIYFRVVVQAR